MNLFYHGLNCIYYCCSADKNEELHERLLDQYQFQDKPVVETEIDIDNFIQSYGELMKHKV